MPTLIVLMIVSAMAFAFWNASRAAAERAEVLGRNACQAANVQWLDHSVHLIAFRVCRKADGWLGFERTFRFDYSIDGENRHIGRIVLRGDQLIAFSGPVLPSVSALH